MCHLVDKTPANGADVRDVTRWGLLIGVRTTDECDWAVAARSLSDVTGDVYARQHILQAEKKTLCK